MALKKATLTWTNQFGETVTRIFKIARIVFDYKTQTIMTEYETHVSEEAEARGAVPLLIQQTVKIDLTSTEDLQFIIEASERIWEKNRAAGFIADFSDTDDDGKQKQTVKSFNDLEATIEEA